MWRASMVEQEAGVSGCHGELLVSQPPFLPRKLAQWGRTSHNQPVRGRRKSATLFLHGPNEARTDLARNWAILTMVIEVVLIRTMIMTVTR